MRHFGSASWYRWSYSSLGVGLALLVCVGAYPSPAQAAKRLLVSPAGSGADGLSWATAYPHLQDALSAAQADPAVTELWVAAGTYRPDRDAAHPSGTGARTATFHLLTGVAIYGGFAGDEAPATFDLASRDFVANPTILSGDLAGNDGPDFANSGENSYHVVTGSGTGATAKLDGFTISGGNADGDSPHHRGGGMYNSSGSPTLTNCTLNGNSAASSAGGMYNFSNHPTVTGCTFTGNSASSGGGMFNFSSSPTLTNCAFSGNSAGGNEGYGGGVLNLSSSPTLTHCTFSGNSADHSGGGMYNVYSSGQTLTHCAFSGNSADHYGGGMYNNQSNPTLTHCTFSGNSAGDDVGYGGGMYNYVSSPTLTNCTFSGNSAANYGGGMYNVESSSPRLINCIVWGNTSITGAQIYGMAAVTYSCIQGGWTGQNNISIDPRFVDADGPDDDPSTWQDNDYRLAAGSPCIDAGLNAAVPVDTLDLDGDGDTTEPIPFDLAGQLRFMDDPATSDCQWSPGTCGTAPIVDMGAYEFIPAIPGDSDRDGDLDLTDLAAFNACVSGPAVGCTGACAQADLDHDGDVDQTDFGMFQRCISGAGRPVDPACTK